MLLISQRYQHQPIPRMFLVIGSARTLGDQRGHRYSQALVPDCLQLQHFPNTTSIPTPEMNERTTDTTTP